MRTILLALLIFSGAAIADSALEETRYCGTPARTSDGRILRRMDVLMAFRNLYPCPATSEKRGACKGWAIDHIIPLAVGGCDAVRNLQWLPDEIKSCAGEFCKDRWERIIYDRTTNKKKEK